MSPASWKLWFINNIRAQGSYFQARPYTDRSVTHPADLDGYFNVTDHHVMARAAIILREVSDHWRRQPVFALNIAEGENLGVDSV